MPDRSILPAINFTTYSLTGNGARWVYFNIPTASFSSLDVTLHRDNGIPNSGSCWEKCPSTAESTGERRSGTWHGRIIRTLELLGW